VFLEHVARAFLHRRVLQSDSVDAIPVFLDREPELVVEVGIGSEARADVGGDGEIVGAGEAVRGPEVLAEGGRDPGAAAGEDGRCVEGRRWSEGTIWMEEEPVPRMAMRLWEKS